jgi:hypothetical protein
MQVSIHQRASALLVARSRSYGCPLRRLPSHERGSVRQDCRSASDPMAKRRSATSDLVWATKEQHRSSRRGSCFPREGGKAVAQR